MGHILLNFKLRIKQCRICSNSTAIQLFVVVSDIQARQVSEVTRLVSTLEDGHLPLLPVPEVSTETHEYLRTHPTHEHR